MVPHRGGCCCCRAETVGHTRASSCESRALQQRLNYRGTRAELLHGVWELSGPGMALVSPAFLGRATRESLKTGFVSVGLVGWFVFGWKTCLWIKFLGCVDAAGTRTGFESYGRRRVCESSLSTMMGLFSELMIGWGLLLPFLGAVVSDSATPGTAARQASLSLTIFRSLLKLVSIESVMPSSHLTLCHPLPLPSSICPSTRVLSNDSALDIRWPKEWSLSFSLSPSSEYSELISFRMACGGF